MFQLRGLQDAWDNTAPDQPDVAAAGAGVFDSIGASFKQIGAMFSPMSSSTTIVPGAVVTAQQTSPGVKTTTVTPVAPKPWYKTPVGIVVILASAFAGYKYVLPKLRK